MAHPGIRHKSPMNPSGRALMLVLLTAVPVALLSGCSTLFEGKYDFRDGWRKGKVQRIVSGDALQRPRYWQCTRRASAEELGGHRYVILSYERPSRLGRGLHVVALPPDLDLHPGQPVYVNAFSCQDAIAVPSGLPHLQRATGPG